MTAARACLAFVVVGIILAWAPGTGGGGAGAAGQDPPPAQQPPIFRSGTSLVRVDVTVRDRSRRAVTNLQAADFVVTDNNVRQDIDDVSFGKLPIDVTVGLDVSYSVTGSILDRLRRAVVQLMNDLGKDDRLKLMLFNMRVQRAMDFTTDVQAVERAIRAAGAGGGTALFDTIGTALVSASSPDRRQLIVMFTDGGDSSSTTTPAMLDAIAARTQATLAFVVPTAMATAITQTASGFNIAARPTSGAASVPAIFVKLAGETGGSVLPVSPATDLTPAFRRILEEFRSTYVLYYSPKGVDRAGFHTIAVSVDRPGAVVQARRGYFGG